MIQMFCVQCIQSFFIFYISIKKSISKKNFIRIKAAVFIDISDKNIILYAKMFD